MVVLRQALFEHDGEKMQIPRAEILSNLLICCTVGMSAGHSSVGLSSAGDSSVGDSSVGGKVIGRLVGSCPLLGDLHEHIVGQRTGAEPKPVVV